ncbi:MBL fold metallo-hydrolase [Candidatus Aerophobetes bacterium]|nr:MBL fold metallo-hydrolase [Candidatus Aerophobetes bacterium]
MMKIMENVYLVGSGQIGLSHPFDCHIYLVDGKDELALIDTGAGERVDKVLSNIEEDGFNPEKIGKIILTHHHADHSGGCKKIKDKTHCRIYIHEEGVKLVEQGDEEKMGLVVAKKSGLYSPNYTFQPFEVDVSIKDGDEVCVGKLKLKVFHTPGHSKDSVCFYIQDEGCKMLFSGDVVLFEGKIGLLNLSGSNLDDYRQSFDKVASLKIDALLPGHSLFTVKEGEQHVKKASLALKKLSPPPNFI